MSALLETQTYLPADQAELSKVEGVLSGGGDGEFALVGPEGRVPIPESVHQILVQVIGAMQAGRAVTLTPQTRKLTTQQAADLIGVSRPTLVKVIESGELPCERVSNRRMLLLEDVLSYQQRRREQQLAAIAATSSDLDDELDDARLQEILKEARATRAARRRRSR